MKVKLFTHTDLDGVGCAILGKVAFGDNIDIEYCNYDDVNEKVGSYIVNNHQIEYDMTFITDISINELTAMMIDINLNPEQIQLLDHHPTAKWLNKYSWARVNEHIEHDVKHSGTMMFYYYLIGVDGEVEYLESSDGIFSFAETVRRYDTWEWKTKYNDLECKRYNDLLYIKGRDRFVRDVYFSLMCHKEYWLNNNEQILLELEQEKIDKYVESKNKQLIKKDILGYSTGVVFAEQYHSELGNRLCELNEDIDFCIIINPSYGVSYRTIKEIDLSQIAKHFGGGGHPKASGSSISDYVKNEIIDLIFK